MKIGDTFATEPGDGHKYLLKVVAVIEQRTCGYERCDNTFEARANGRRYCSNRCAVSQSNLAGARRRSARRKRTTDEITTVGTGV